MYVKLLILIPALVRNAESSLTGINMKRKLNCLLQVLMQIADEFIESVVTSSCKIAKHRKSSSLDVKDVQLHLGKYRP